MKIGPIVTPTVIASNPLKPIAVKTTHNRHTLMFGGTFPVPMQSDIVEYTVTLPLMGTSPAASRALAAQLVELGTNGDWQRAGIYLQMREDGITDAQDGWYGLGAIETPEEEPAASGWVEAKIDILLRARRAQSIGVFVDQKAQPNDFSLGGVALAAYPQGVGQGFPAATYELVGHDGYTQYVVENGPAVMRAPFIDPTATMINGRVSVWDEVS